MRVVIQRTGHASVTINGTCKSAIRKGFMILVGIEETDGKEDIDWLCKKIVNLRVFDDENGVMNKSILDIDGEILVISQFTLHASTRKGNRPSYIRAAKPEISVPLYEQFCKELSFALGKETHIPCSALTDVDQQRAGTTGGVIDFDFFPVFQVVRNDL